MPENIFAGWRLSMRDMTAWKIAQLKLAETERQWRLLMENMGEGVSILNAKNIFLYNNPSAENIFGIGKGKLIGRSITDFISKNDNSKIWKKVKNLKTGNNLTIELTLNIKNGLTKVILLTATPIIEDSGTKNICIFRDITKQKNQEQNIRKKNDELHLLNAHKDKFFSIIAHDLRSPLNALLGLPSMMEKNFHFMSKDDILHLIKLMKMSASNLHDLVENLLQWAQIESGILNTKISSFQLLNVVDKCIDIFSVSILQKQHQIDISVPENIIVMADRNMVESVIRNLLSNAIKFTPRNGKIKIWARYSGTTHIKFSIRDNGIGIPPVLIKDIFKIEANTSRKGTDGELSSGLGLILSKKFIEANGGKLWLRSRTDNGSVFNFTLPLNK